MRLDVHLIRSRAVRLCATSVAALALAPATAGAAGVSVSSGVLSYTASTGEANALTVTRSGPSYEVRDTGTTSGSKPIPLQAAGGCAPSAPGTALCSGVWALRVSLGDGNDTVDLTHVSLSSSVDAGAGNDSLALNNGAFDAVACGSGTDSGSADAGDFVGSDCESVQKLPVDGAPATSGTLGVTPPPTGTAGGSGTTAQPPAGGAPVTHGVGSPGSRNGSADPAAPTIPAQTVTVTPHGDALVEVVCPQASGGCSGTVTLEVPRSSLGKLATAARKRKLVKLGSTRFHAKAGQKVAIRVPLERRGRWRVVRGRRVRCRITVAAQSSTGTKSVTTSEITLVARRTASRGRAR